jgi:hypothetical protein
MSTKIRPTLAIIYGFAEGPKVSKRLRQLLQRMGFDVIDDPKKADIIITHSGGAYYLPDDLEGKTVLLVAPTYWRKKDSLVLSSLIKLYKEAWQAIRKQYLGLWLEKSCMNALYAFGDVPSSVRMYRKAKLAGRIFPLCNARRVGIISQRGDTWSGHLEDIVVADYSRYCLISNSGSHDNLWIHPKDYAAVIQYLHES